MSESNVPTTVSVLKIMTMLPARYISWARIALSRIGPVVCRLRTMEISTSPETIPGSTHPIVLIMGLIAVRTGYFNKIRVSGSPLARAVITYCFCNSSNRFPRMTRIVPPVPARPIRIMGSQICFNISRNLAQLQGASRYSEENSPRAEKSKNLKKAHASTNANKKPGVAKPMKPINVKI